MHNTQKFQNIFCGQQRRKVVILDQWDTGIQSPKCHKCESQEFRQAFALQKISDHSFNAWHRCCDLQRISEIIIHCNPEMWAAVWFQWQYAQCVFESDLRQAWVLLPSGCLLSPCCAVSTAPSHGSLCTPVCVCVCASLSVCLWTAD